LGQAQIGPAVQADAFRAIRAASPLSLVAATYLRGSGALIS